jgi:hypothetical protein
VRAVFPVTREEGGYELNHAAFFHYLVSKDGV